MTPHEAEQSAPPSNRHALVTDFWKLAESIGPRTILQHMIDEMPMTKLEKLVKWVDRQRPSTGAVRTPEEDAATMMEALGVCRQDIARLMAIAKEQGPANANDLVRRMLVARTPPVGYRKL